MVCPVCEDIKAHYRGDGVWYCPPCNHLWVPDWTPEPDQMERILKSGLVPDREPSGRLMLWLQKPRGRVGQTTDCWEDVLRFCAEQSIAI